VRADIARDSGSQALASGVEHDDLKRALAL
jgi:hypothetical protein